MQQSQAAITARRQQVGLLWLRGMSPTRIATMLKASRRTVERDVAAIRDELTRASVATLEAKAARSVATLRLVQSEAWALFARLHDLSNSKIGALNTIANTEATIARIEGTLSGDQLTQQTTVSVLVLPEYLAARSALVAALAPFPDARRAVVDALAALEGAAEGGGNDGHSG